MLCERLWENNRAVGEFLPCNKDNIKLDLKLLYYPGILVRIISTRHYTHCRFIQKYVDIEFRSN